MWTHSLWNDFADTTDFPMLQKNIVADVAIIGGGITGISTGLLLSSKGKKVVIVEERKVGGGTSSHSTGNLYTSIDHLLSSLRPQYDLETVKRVVAARKAAQSVIEQTVKKYSLDCDFKKCGWILYAANEKYKKKIEKEYMVAKEAGLDVTEVTVSEMPVPASTAIAIPGQAQFNPMRYVQGLAKAIAGDNCLIYEQTRVVKIQEKKEFCEIQTTGGTITAQHVVHATHTPKGIMLVQTLLGPYREYGIACRLKGPLPPEGIYWGYDHQGEKFSFRTYQRDQSCFLLVVGKPHKVGQAKSNKTHIRALEKFANEHFDVGEVVYRWGGQHYRPADLLPYIGRKEKNSPVFIATGYSTDGLVYGVLAGMIIADEISGTTNLWSGLCDSTRHQPLKAAKQFIKENTNVAKQYLKNLPGVADSSSLDDIKAGEGKIIEQNGQKLAACRGDDNQLHVRSAVCTHLSCIVAWNNAEQTWDCPCHGSRFAVDGSVLEGPAYHPLPEIKIIHKKVKTKHVE
jgi:glycine/D-amino acid oxidase-like deaminating enzyme/nitrite reductase/ring-hydroxylating ferredoxin subunit